MGNPRFLVTRSPNGRGLSPIGTGQHQICLVRPFLSRKAIFFWVLWAPPTPAHLTSILPRHETVTSDTQVTRSQQRLERERCSVQIDDIGIRRVSYFTCTCGGNSFSLWRGSQTPTYTSWPHLRPQLAQCRCCVLVSARCGMPADTDDALSRAVHREAAPAPRRGGCRGGTRRSRLVDLPRVPLARAVVVLLFARPLCRSASDPGEPVRQNEAR